MLLSKLLGLAILGWPISFTFGAPNMGDVFELATPEAKGGCSASQLIDLHRMFPEMQTVAINAHALYDGQYLKQHFLQKYQLAASFGVAHGGAVPEEFTDFMYEPAKQILGGMSAFLSPGPGTVSMFEKTLLWCNSLPLIWRKATDSPADLRSVIGDKTIAQFFADIHGVADPSAIDDEWWIFTATITSSGDESTLFLLVPRERIPGVEVNGIKQPFPSGDDESSGPSPCNHPTTSTWGLHGAVFKNGQIELRRVVILCERFWPDKRKPPALLSNIHRAPVVDDALQAFQPMWFDLYIAIFQALLPLDMLNAPVITPARPPPDGAFEAGFTYKEKAHWEKQENGAHAHDATQCMAVALWDQAEPVSDNEELLAPRTPACLTWFSVANYLTQFGDYKYDFSLGHVSYATDYNPGEETLKAKQKAMEEDGYKPQWGWEAAPWGEEEEHEGEEEKEHEEENEQEAKDEHSTSEKQDVT